VKTGEKLNSALELAKRYIGIFEEKTGKKVEDRELSEEQISTIIRLYKQGWNISRISRTVGISEDYVELIVEKYATE
jgi:transposase-like protein